MLSDEIVNTPVLSPCKAQGEVCEYLGHMVDHRGDTLLVIRFRSGIRLLHPSKVTSIAGRAIVYLDRTFGLV